jgi:hypothetical protein
VPARADARRFPDLILVRFAGYFHRGCPRMIPKSLSSTPIGDGSRLSGKIMRKKVSDR